MKGEVERMKGEVEGRGGGKREEKRGGTWE